MSPQTANSLRRLNLTTESLFAELQSWPPESLCFRPTAEAWSALDLMEHLRLAEAAVLTTMQHNLEARNRITILDRFRSAFILGIMLLPTRVKVPGQVTEILPPAAQKDFEAIRKEWAEDRKRLAAFVESLSTTDHKRGIFRHPVGGWTTPNGALLFLRSHLRHHRYQVARLWKAVGRPLQTPPSPDRWPSRPG
jgi:hypothetical protein